jgi:hypothetical protein
MTSEPMLRRLYNSVNRDWFGGELPDDVPIWFEPCSHYAETIEIQPAIEGEPPTLGIRVNPSMMAAWDLCKIKVAHECIHVKQWQAKRRKNHGIKFDQEIQRLCTFRTYRKLL